MLHALKSADAVTVVLQSAIGMSLAAIWRNVRGVAGNSYRACALMTDLRSPTDLRTYPFEDCKFGS
jgi:hypothetical protein